MNKCNNPFGELMRRYRLDHYDTLRTLAEKLGVSAAFISSLELGKKQIPVEYIDKIAELYNLNETQKIELADAVHYTNKKVTLDLTDLDEETKELSLVFARKIKSNDEELISKLRNILYGDEN